MNYPEFERRFLFAARDHLRCRLTLMGGHVESERCATPGEMEGALLGMLDWRGEIQILCQEALGGSAAPPGSIPAVTNRQCVALEREPCYDPFHEVRQASGSRKSSTSAKEAESGTSGPDVRGMQAGIPPYKETAEVL